MDGRAKDVKSGADYSVRTEQCREVSADFNAQNSVEYRTRMMTVSARSWELAFGFCRANRSSVIGSARVPGSAWTFGLIYTFYSGDPLTITTGSAFAGVGAAGIHNEPERHAMIAQATNAGSVAAAVTSLNDDQHLEVDPREADQLPRQERPPEYRAARRFRGVERGFHSRLLLRNVFDSGLRHNFTPESATSPAAAALYK